MSQIATGKGPWWLTRAATVALVGLGFSAVFALGLGFLIPRQVANEFLTAQATADQVTLNFLLSTEAIPINGTLDYQELDEFVQRSILHGDFVRAKLWAVDGTIIYSDAEELVGQQFVHDEDFPNLRAPMSHLSDLSEDENYLEASEHDGPLLETYVPVLDGDEVLAVWEIYRPMDAYAQSVATTQRVVWLGVGSGLAILGVFLVLSFGLMIRTADEQKGEAQARSEDLAQLLEVAQSTTKAGDLETLARALTSVLAAAPQVAEATVTTISATGEERILVDVSPKDAGPRALRSPPVEVSSTTTSGTSIVRLQSSSQSGSAPTMLALAEEINVGVQNAMLTRDLNDYKEQITQVMDQLMVSGEKERRQLAGFLHDGLAQDLYRILYGLRSLSSDLPSEMSPEFEEIEEVVLDASRTLRDLLRDLYPTVAEDLGLAAAMRSLADRIEEEYKIDVRLDLTSCPEPDNDVKLAVYRIAQEALVNVARHSGHDRAQVIVGSNSASVSLTVLDEGSGADRPLTPGLGMWLMRERAEHLEGHVEFEISDHGMTVRAEIPMRGAG